MASADAFEKKYLEGLRSQAAPSSPQPLFSPAQLETLKSQFADLTPRFLRSESFDKDYLGGLRTPQSAPTEQPSAVVARGQGGSMLPAAVTPADVAIQPSTPPAPQQPTTTRFGLRQEGNTFTLGTPGQDGYGRMTVTPAPQSQQQVDATGAPIISLRGAAKGTPEYDRYVAYNRAKAAAPEQLATTQQSIVFPKPPVYGDKGGGWQTRAKLYAEDMDRYKAEVGAMMQQEGLRQKALTPNIEETPAQIGLRQAQASEAQARTDLIKAQTKEVGAEKPVVVYDEIMTTDAATGLPTKQRVPRVTTPTEEKAVAAERQTMAAAQAKRDTFGATYAKTPEQQKAWAALTPAQQDAVMQQEAQANAQQ